MSKTSSRVNVATCYLAAAAVVALPLAAAAVRVSSAAGSSVLAVDRARGICGRPS